MSRKPHEKYTAMLAKIRTTRTAYIEAIRAVLNARKHKCDDPKCPGWFVNSEYGDIERCDMCASENGYSAQIDDAACAVLPEAIKAQRAFRVQESEDNDD